MIPYEADKNPRGVRWSFFRCGRCLLEFLMKINKLAVACAAIAAALAGCSSVEPGAITAQPRNGEIRYAAADDENASIEELSRQCSKYVIGRYYYSAATTCHKAADGGDAPAQTEVGLMYKKGKGFSKDEKLAFYWLAEAASQGYLKAEYEIARCYVEGIGTEVDLDEAVDWAERAAEAGYGRAQAYYGWMLETGTGVKRNYREAIEWYRKAARKGISSAMRSLARMNRMGIGVPKNEGKYRYWQRMAVSATVREECMSALDGECLVK